MEEVPRHLKDKYHLTTLFEELRVCIRLTLQTLCSIGQITECRGALSWTWLTLHVAMLFNCTSVVCQPVISWDMLASEMCQSSGWYYMDCFIIDSVLTKTGNTLISAVISWTSLCSLFVVVFTMMVLAVIHLDHLKIVISWYLMWCNVVCALGL